MHGQRRARTTRTSARLPFESISARRRFCSPATRRAARRCRGGGQGGVGDGGGRSVRGAVIVCSPPVPQALAENRVGPVGADESRESCAISAPASSGNEVCSRSAFNRFALEGSQRR